MEIGTLDNLKTLRTIYIISGDLWAGAEVQVYNTLVALAREEDVEILCVVFNNGILLQKLAQAGIRCDIIDETRNTSLRMLVRLLKITREFRPDIIHAHRNKEHFLAACTARLSRRNIPVVRTVHGLSRIPDSLPLLQRLRSNVVVIIDTLLIKYMTNAIIAVSNDLEEHLSVMRPKGRITCVNNSVDVSRILRQSTARKPREEYGIGDAFWIGAAVRFVGVKNIPMLIRSGKRLQEDRMPFHISIFGEGPMEKEYNALIGSLKLQKEIQVNPFEQDIFPVIRALDVFVLCSHHEGMPMSLLEAMALERPVVCTAVGGMKEIIQNERNGLLVPDNDHEALAMAIERIYRDKDLAQKLGSNAVSTVRNSYSMTQTTRLLVSLYSSLID